MKTKITAHITRLRILLFCISMLTVASVTIVGSVEAGYLMQGVGQTRASTQATATAQAAPAEKTVEQVEKNIQVLTGLPQSQLVPVMNYMGSSLGVKCTFCHVKNGDKWDFVSDAKPEKGSAREMIQMVQSINKTNFKGNPAVSCFTCHRGDNEPVRVPQLPMA